MSSPFNYEIDERNLRTRMRGMSYTNTEDAWSQFEIYSDSLKQNHKKSALPEIKLNISRGIVLPVIFGGVIISFSLLLFNFISIKNKAPKSEEKKLAQAEPKKEEPKKIVAVIPAVKHVDTVVAAIKTDSSQIKAIAVSQPSVAETKSIAPTPTAPAIAVEAPKKEVQPVQKTEIPTERAWITTEKAEIFSKPDNKSEVVGNASINHKYEAIEETNYYIKVNFQSNGSQQTGYIKKLQVRKNSGIIVVANGKKRKRSKAEIIEPMQVPTSLPVSEAKEPELK